MAVANEQTASKVSFPRNFGSDDGSAVFDIAASALLGRRHYERLTLVNDIKRAADL